MTVLIVEWYPAGDGGRLARFTGHDKEKQ